MKYKFTILTVILICFSIFFQGIAYAYETVHSIPKLNMKVTTTDELISITRDSQATDLVFTEYGLNYTSTMQALEKDNVYLYTQAKDGSCTITVSMIENEESKSYYDFATLSKVQQDEIVAAFTAQTECNNCYTYELPNGQAFFFCPTSKYVNPDGSQISVAQYITIVNGQRIIFQLTVNGGTYTNDQVSLLKSMVDSVEFTSITKKSFDINSVMPYVYALIGVLAILIVVMVVLIIRNKNNKNIKAIENEQVDFDAFLENTQVFLQDANSDDEPEEPLVIVSDAEHFGKPIEKEQPKQEQIEINEVHTEDENSAEVEIQDEPDKVSDDNFVVVRNDVSPDTEESLEATEEDIDILSESFEEVVDIAIDEDSYEDIEIKSHMKKQNKKPDNVFAKIGLGIMNALIGVVLLILYLISMITNNDKKRKNK